MKDLCKIVQSFTEDLNIRNRAKRTISTHLWHLGKFFLFLEDYTLDSIQDIRETHIKDYQRYRYTYKNRYNRNDAPSTQNHHLQSIKCFYYYLLREGYVLTNPALKIPYAKEPRQLPKGTITNKEMKKILAQPDTKTLIGYRDRTILEVFYSTGIRRSELLHLKLDDIDSENGYLRVNHGKGDKDRVVPLGKIASHYLETYIKGIRPFFLNAREEKILFISRRGRQMGRNTLDHLISKYVETSGIDKNVTTHTFRRTCATEMIKNKANIMHVKQLLGHKSMETIQKYCNLTIVDLKEAHRKHHPREKEHI
ncbi:tyrosine-type recombinase/integrase [Chlamydiota bacterium]